MNKYQLFEVKLEQVGFSFANSTLGKVLESLMV